MKGWTNSFRHLTGAITFDLNNDSIPNTRVKMRHGYDRDAPVYVSSNPKPTDMNEIGQKEWSQVRD